MTSPVIGIAFVGSKKVLNAPQGRSRSEQSKVEEICTFAIEGPNPEVVRFFCLYNPTPLPFPSTFAGPQLGTEFLTHAPLRTQVKLRTLLIGLGKEFFQSFLAYYLSGEALLIRWEHISLEIW